MTNNAASKPLEARREALNYELRQAHCALKTAYSEYSALVPEHARLRAICGREPSHPVWTKVIGAFLGGAILVPAIAAQHWLVWLIFFVYVVIAMWAAALQTKGRLKYLTHRPAYDDIARRERYLANEISELECQIETARTELESLNAILVNAVL